VGSKRQGGTGKKSPKKRMKNSSEGVRRQVLPRGDSRRGSGRFKPDINKPEDQRMTEKGKKKTDRKQKTLVPAIASMKE